MNNTFNIKRFGYVFRKDLMENWKRYILLFITMLGIMAIAFICFSLINYNIMENSFSNHSGINSNMLIMTLLMFAGFGLLFASTLMNPMNNKIKRISYLINPASNLEKYLSRWIIMTIAYIIVFFIALYVVDILRVGITAAAYPDMDVKFLDLSKLIRENDEVGSRYYIFRNNYYFFFALSIYFLMQSLFVLGSTFWEKTTFVKTFSVVTVLIIFFFLFCYFAIKLFYGDFDDFGNVMNSFEFMYKRNFDENLVLKFTSCVISVFTLINWVFAFFRFRESEIIKRF